MANPNPINKKDYVQRLHDEGYREKIGAGNPEPVSYRGRLYDESIIEKGQEENEGIIGKAKQVAGYVFETTSNCLSDAKSTISTFSSDVLDSVSNTFSDINAPTITDLDLVEELPRVQPERIANAPKVHLGYERKKVYTNGQDGPLPKGLGFDPKDPKSISKFLQKPEIMRKTRQAYGHHYYVVTGRTGITSILFIPKTKEHTIDYDKAHSIKMWKAKNGAPLTETNDFLRAVKGIAATYDEVQEKIGEKVNEMALKMAKKLEFDPEANDYQEKVKQLEKEVRARIETIAYDFDKHQIRLYGRLDPNTAQTDSPRTGTVINLSEEAGKEIDTIYDKNLMEHKGDLEGDLPFKDIEDDKENDLMKQFEKLGKGTKNKTIDFSDDDYDQKNYGFSENPFRSGSNFDDYRPLSGGSHPRVTSLDNTNTSTSTTTTTTTTSTASVKK